MTSPKITDAHVQRCRGWFQKQFGTSHSIDATREMLEYALASPEEEIPISEAMCEAAMALYAKDGGKYLVAPMFAKYYRAMERVRRKELEACKWCKGQHDPAWACGAWLNAKIAEAAPSGASIPSPSGGWLHQRHSDTGTTVGAMHKHIRAGERCWDRAHRRKDDPK